MVMVMVVMYVERSIEIEGRREKAMGKAVFSCLRNFFAFLFTFEG
jgi:hypothetical protein